MLGVLLKTILCSLFCSLLSYSIFTRIFLNAGIIKTHFLLIIIAVHVTIINFSYLILFLFFCWKTWSTSEKHLLLHCSVYFVMNSIPTWMPCAWVGILFTSISYTFDVDWKQLQLCVIIRPGENVCMDVDLFLFAWASSFSLMFLSGYLVSSLLLTFASHARAFVSLPLHYFIPFIIIIFFFWSMTFLLLPIHGWYYESVLFSLRMKLS